MNVHEEYKFYGSYLKLIEEDYYYRKNVENTTILGINTEFNNKLKHAKFRNFVISKLGKNYLTISKLKDIMRSLIIRPQRLLTDNIFFYIGCDMITNTYYICYKELMMIDIDFYKDDKDKSESLKLEDIINIFMKDIEDNPNNCWSLYKTRGGIHAFLLSKKMNYNLKETCEYMLKLGCDFNYVIYTHLRGWSVRLNRKEKEEKMKNELLCQLGNPQNIDKNLERQLNLHNKLIEVFKEDTPSLMYGV